MCTMPVDSEKRRSISGGSSGYRHNNYQWVNRYFKLTPHSTYETAIILLLIHVAWTCRSPFKTLYVEKSGSSTFYMSWPSSREPLRKHKQPSLLSSANKKLRSSSHLFATFRSSKQHIETNYSVNYHNIVKSDNISCLYAPKRLSKQCNKFTDILYGNHRSVDSRIILNNNNINCLC